MPLVRAKEDCYLGETGYKAKGEEFEYSGPKHDSLEPLKKGRQEEPAASSDSNQ